MEYKYIQEAGAVQDAMTGKAQKKRKRAAVQSDVMIQQAALPDFFGQECQAETPATNLAFAPATRTSGLDATHSTQRRTMFHHIVEEGQRALVTHPDGRVEVAIGPCKVFRRGRRIRTMDHYVAHPGEFLICRFRDGRQEHLPGPAHLWFDPREHQSVEKEDALQIAAKEVVVVYSKAEDGSVARRLVHGPATFVPEPGEWLHTFSWHGSAGGAMGYEKTPDGLVFQKLWMMPDQMYHDVPDVRTSDDAVLTIKLMLFFEMIDVERMLETTHDPIGDFVNAATSDIVDFVGRHEFDSFKRNTEQLNDLAVYRQLTARADSSGYRINKVVYRGYGAPESLQQMHDQAIESRTRLQFEKATEEQAQELEDLQLERRLARAAKERTETDRQVEQEIRLAGERHEAALDLSNRERAAELKRLGALDEQREAHLRVLADLGVDLTAYLTQARADRLIEVRGGPAGPHVHLDGT